MLSDAVENEVILKNPVTKQGSKCNFGKESKKVRALTLDEQKNFLRLQ